MVGREHWLTVATASDPDDLREHILTGYKAGKPFTPYTPPIALPQPIDRVLDFGCGVGRSVPYLKQVARHVTGFETFPPMVARCRTLAPVPADCLLDLWEDVALADGIECFDASGDCVEVDHDPATHQLRALGRRSLSDACQAGGGHFELVLRSRRPDPAQLGSGAS